ncbi:ATP-binding protein [Actinoplanes sp. NPDC051851]|uniref:MacS family sensor histidine kinase n=1 Tax=Actinoplanes sp. NPDC051851 TaxID=3154753 RepID=UPI003431C83F
MDVEGQGSVRSLLVFRAVALAGIAAQMIRDGGHYQHRAAAWPLFAGIALWTALTAWAYPRFDRHRRVVLLLDLAVTVAVIRAGVLVEGVAATVTESVRITGWWPASLIVAWTLAEGWRGGLVAAGCLIGIGTAFGDRANTLGVSVLMLLAALAVGLSDRRHLALAQRLREALQREAAARERERLSRDIHDTVLQSLAMIARRGAELGGEAAELGRLAGGQERVLREVMVAPRGAPRDGERELAAALREAARRPGVAVLEPRVPVWLPAGTVRELTFAVESALDNVARHCGPGARAWVLIEAEPDRVRILIRDDGPGMAPERAAQAGVEGRLGIARSIRGRLHDLGGAADISSAPGLGTLVELSVPR